MRIERRDIRRQIRIILQHQIESRSHISLFDQPPPDARRANALQRQFVFVQPAHHIEIDISDDGAQRD